MARRLTADSPQMRLDAFLAARLEGYTRSAAKSLVEKGLVTVDGKPGEASRKLKGGEKIVIEEAESAWDEDFSIVHEDPHLMVIVKPAGLLMHPLGETWLTRPEASLQDQPNLAGLLYKRGLGRVPRCGIVHRLDRQTSGLLVVAKTAKASAALIERFKDREMDKTYRAVVRGIPKDQKARVEAPIGRKPGHRKVEVTPFGKTAQTQLSVVETAKGHALVEAKPLTGRTHQIRAHLALIGHPVAGDPEFEAPDAQPKAPRLMLHAWKLSFEHPMTGKPASFTAPPPSDFRSFWASCKKS